MKVTAHFHGILADWVGSRSAVFELSNDATYPDLIAEIKQRFGGNMPVQLWDAEKNRFHQKVRAFRDGKALGAAEVKLEQGEELTFFLMIAGG
jgi:predicted SpoU family rRNA methylase